MRKSIKISIVAVLLSLTALHGSAQQTTSPYSRFGFGLLGDNATSAQTQMGGVGYAMRSGRQINVMNPAAYAATDTLTFLFDMGLDFSFYSQKDGVDKRNDNGGGLDYVTMQFPIGNRMGMSLGLLPYSSVGYSFGSDIDNGSSSHEGSGGLNQLYLGFAGRPFGGLSLGFNISYLFGTTYNDVYARTNSAATSLFEQVMQVRDFHLLFGAQYTQKFGVDEVTLGLTYSPGKDLLGHSWIQKYDIGSDAAPDTLNYISLRRHYSLPETWGAGVAWTHRQSLNVEADFTYQPWSKAKLYNNENFTATHYANRYRIAAGASWRPAQRGGYLRRITYRAGFNYTRDYVMVGDNHVKQYGVSLGFGFPAPGQKTVLNLGFEYLHRQGSPQALVKEDYFNIKLGINFNQLWFMQSKIR